MFSLRPMNTPDQAKRTDTGKRRSKPPEPICECENSVALTIWRYWAALVCSRIARNSANVCLKAVRRRGWGILLCARWIHAIASIPAHASSPVDISAYGAFERQELSQHRITLDARPFSERIGAWLAYPRHYAKVQIGLALCAIPLACFWLAFLLASIGLHLWFHQQLQGLPMRMPHDLGGIDPSLDVVKRTPNGRGERVEQHAAEGIFYLGNQRS